MFIYNISDYLSFILFKLLMRWFVKGGGGSQRARHAPQPGLSHEETMKMLRHTGGLPDLFDVDKAYLLVSMNYRIFIDNCNQVTLNVGK